MKPFSSSSSFLYHPLPTEDNYSPVVPSPLNPTGAYQIQTKRSRPRWKVRIAGSSFSGTGRTAAAGQSPTEALLRHKAAIAFYNARAKGGRARCLAEAVGGGGDFGLARMTTVHLWSQVTDYSDVVEEDTTQTHTHPHTHTNNNSHRPGVGRREVDEKSLEARPPLPQQPQQQQQRQRRPPSPPPAPAEHGPGASRSEFLVDLTGVVAVETLTTVLMTPPRGSPLPRHVWRRQEGSVGTGGGGGAAAAVDLLRSGTGRFWFLMSSAVFVVVLVVRLQALLLGYLMA